MELIRHSLYSHVLPQISKFITAPENKETYDKLVKIFQNELPSTKKIGEEKIKSIISNREIIIEGTKITSRNTKLGNKYNCEIIKNKIYCKLCLEKI